jgi:adenine-specific DNA-methyltransferase
MATGVPKTKWNGNEEVNNQNVPHIATLSYPNKRSEQSILAMSPGSYCMVNQVQNEFGRLFYDDNLPVLAHLCSDSTVFGKVKLIYIDPPYATGRVFKSRAQKDAYVDVKTGTQYLEFIRQRLVFLRELLSDDGSIYVHLDQNMAFHVKLLMDEIFGPRNFRNWITRKKSNPKNYTRKTYGNISDYILFYTKSNTYVWNRAYYNWTEEDSKREYSCIEKSTGRRYKKVPVHAPGTRNGATGKVWRGKMPPKGKHWQYTPAKLDEMDARGEIYWSPTGNPRRKIYLDESKGKPVQDIWLDSKDAHNQNIKITGYPTEKNPTILRRIIQASSNPKDLVLDCFAGSGTTLDVAKKLDRQWIGVDNSQLAIETILKRFMYGMNAMGDFVQPSKSSHPVKNALPLDFSLHCNEDHVSSVQDIITALQENASSTQKTDNETVNQPNSPVSETKKRARQLGLFN